MNQIESVEILTAEDFEPMFYYMDWDTRCIRCVTIKKLDQVGLENLHAREDKINRFLFPFEIMERFGVKPSKGMKQKDRDSLKFALRKFCNNSSYVGIRMDKRGRKQDMKFHHSVDWSILHGQIEFQQPEE